MQSFTDRKCQAKLLDQPSLRMFLLLPSLSYIPGSLFLLWCWSFRKPLCCQQAAGALQVFQPWGVHSSPSRETWSLSLLVLATSKRKKEISDFLLLRLKISVMCQWILLDEKTNENTSAFVHECYTAALMLSSHSIPWVKSRESCKKKLSVHSYLFGLCKNFFKVLWHPNLYQN